MEIRRENKPLLEHIVGHLEKCGGVNFVLNANASKEHNNQDMKESPIQNLIAREKQIISNI